LVVHQSDVVLAAMDDWNTKHHGGSGLVDRVKASTISDADAEAQTVAFINQHCGAKDRPVLAGNSIHQDRRFIRRYMPVLDARLHYRMVDVSTVEELARRWYPAITAKQPGKNETHRALDDIRESIQELRYYRQHVFAAPTT
ncbi:MAG TPA: oligoribonuclease, partial [Kofleriaceae bacterium]